MAINCDIPEATFSLKSKCIDNRPQVGKLHFLCLIDDIFYQDNSISLIELQVLLASFKSHLKVKRLIQ